MNTLLGIKQIQTQRFLQNGKRTPVTVIKIDDNRITGVKTQDLHGYTALQMGLGTKKNPSKAALGNAKKAQFDTVSYHLKEFRMADVQTDLVGTTVAVDTVFQPGDKVQVTGVSKGKGFAGVVKRHNFRGGPRTHGQSDRERHPGSIGQTTTPGRVYKGKRMAGRMGQDTITVKNLTIVGMDPVAKLLLIDGLVPGVKNSMVIVTKIGEDKQFVPLQPTSEEAEVAEQKRLQEEAEQAKIDAQSQAIAEKTKVEEAPIEENTEAVVSEEAVAPLEQTVEVADETPVSEDVASPEEVKSEETEEGK